MNHVKDVLLEPNPKTMFSGHIQKMDGWIPMCMTEGRCSSSEYHLTNTDLVLIPGKPRSITLNFSIQYLLYNYYAFTFLGVDWNLSCIIPRFPQLLY